MAARDSSAAADEALVRVDAVLGSEGGWRSQLASAQVDVLRLDPAEAQKSRLRKTTEGGVEVAVSLERGTQLHDGDVLLWDEAARTALVARVELADVLVIELGAVMAGPRQAALATCVQLGHALGSQHWPAVVKGTRVFVPLSVAREVMASVLKTHDFDAVTFAFVPGAEVAAELAPNDTRRLFGTGAGHGHQHAPGPPGEAPA
jgi:urease accessory protein